MLVVVLQTACWVRRAKGRSIVKDVGLGENQTFAFHLPFARIFRGWAQGLTGCDTLEGGPRGQSHDELIG